MHKIGQSGGFLSKLLGLLLKTESLLMKNKVKPLAKSVLIKLGLRASTSATDAAIHHKMFGPSVTILIIWNEQTSDIMKIDKSLEQPGLWIKDVSETIKSKAKKLKRGFLSVLLNTLGAS